MAKYKALTGSVVKGLTFWILLAINRARILSIMCQQQSCWYNRKGSKTGQCTVEAWQKCMTKPRWAEGQGATVQGSLGFKGLIFN